jgi:Zn2+/Cd2+-exporting ATPase
MILGAFGFATMWEAVFADVGVAIIAILNSARMLGYKAQKPGNR